MTEPHHEIEPKYISYILDNPWKISQGEWRLTDEKDKEVTLLFIMERLRMTDSDGYSKLWKTESDEPIAILGGFKVGERKYETFFVASKHMEDHALRLSFDMRQILREQAPRHKGCTCGLYSESEHPSQISWFRFLGFNYMPQGNIGNTRYFEYVSPMVSKTKLG